MMRSVWLLTGIGREVEHQPHVNERNSTVLFGNGQQGRVAGLGGPFMRVDRPTVSSNSHLRSPLLPRVRWDGWTAPVVYSTDKQLVLY